MPELLSRLWATLDDDEVAYCLLRGADRLNPPPGDVDLLISTGDVERFHAAAGAAGFARERRWAQDTQHHLLGLDGEQPIALHAVTEVGFGPPTYPWRLDLAEGVLRRAVPAGPSGPAVAASADEFWISLHHCLLDKGAIAPHHRRRLADLVGHADAGDDAAGHLPPGLRRLLLQAVADGDWPSALRRRRRVDLAVRRADGWRGVVRGPRRRLELLWRKVGERVTRRGISAALLAPDGAGKSTLAAGLAAAGPLPVRTVYLGLYPSAGERPARTLPPGLSLLARVAQLWRRWLVALGHRSRRRVVVFDRHPLDARLPRRGDGPGGRLRRWVLGHALPLPDLVMVLDAPPAELLRRSGEHDLDTLDRQRQGYLALARTLPAAVVLDATAPAAAVRAAAWAAIWQVHLDRHRAGR